MNATELKKGQKATITSISEHVFSRKLLEMGCIPGTPVFLEFTSPSGDPIALNIDGYILGLRLSEAKLIQVELAF